MPSFHNGAVEISYLDEGEGEPGATWVQNYLFTRARTIAGGTSEVQRNVVANELLGA